MELSYRTFAVAALLCTSFAQARTVEDALCTRPAEDNRAVVNEVARRAAGAWVANGEIRGKVLFEDLVKDEASVKARWNMTKNGITVVGDDRGGKCIRLTPDRKNFINLTQKRGSFIPFKKGEPIAILWEARTPEGGASPFFRYDTYDKDYKHVSATEFRSVVDPTEPQAFHRNSFVFMPPQDGYFMIFFHVNPSDEKPGEVANIRGCELKDVIASAMSENVDAQRERDRAGNRLVWYVSDSLSSSYPVMPVGTRVPGRAWDVLRIRECPGEKTRATVVLWSASARENVTLEFTDFDGGAAGRIPASAFTAKTVKCHYQGTGAPFNNCIFGDGQVLVPELLLNDDALVVPDHETHRNFVKFTDGGASRYVDINTITNKSWGNMISMKSMPIVDAPKLRPFSLEAGLNKQLALRLAVPKGARPGAYSGKMRVRDAGGVLAEVPISVEVLPFSLPETAETVYDPSRNYTMGLYTWTRLGPVGTKGSMSPFHRSDAQVEKVYSLLYDNGVRNPAFIWPNAVVYNEAEFRRHLGIIRKIGFRNPLVLGSSGHIGNYTNDVDIAKMQDRIRKALKVAGECGYPDVYFYGFDEAYGARLLSQRKAWKAAREVGAKVVVSGGNGHFEKVGDLLDLCIYHADPEMAIPSKWHSVGHRLWKYGSPQTGPEDPKLFRRNYGLYLWHLGFDGGNTYCEMDADGVWNDISSLQKKLAAGKGGGCYRSHSMLYPTVDGAIETLALTGLESAIKDVRYMTKFLQMLRARHDADAHKWFDAIDFGSTDPAQIRRETIDWILRLAKK